MFFKPGRLKIQKVKFKGGCIMKKMFITVLTLLMAAALIFAAVEKFTANDFKKDGAQASTGGWWYVYNDSSSGGNSEVTPAPDKFVMAKSGDKFAARMQGKTGNKLGWDYVGMGLTFGEKCGCPGGAQPFDLSKYTTLTLRIKGSITGGRIAVIIPYSDNKCDNEKTASLTNWADYEMALNSKLTKDWSVVKIDLRKDLKQPKWAKEIVPIEKVLQNAHNINFHFSSPDGDAVDFQVDTIEFN
jgi:hypothetical protein